MMEILFLARIESLLDVPLGIKEQALRELEAHLNDIKSELMDTGMNVEQAEKEAEKRLGDPAAIAASLNAAHASASLKSAIISVVPFVCSAGFILLRNPGLQMNALALLLAVFSIGSIRELANGRRPVWLATWLAGTFVSLFGLINWSTNIIWGQSIRFDYLLHSNPALFIGLSICAVALAVLFSRYVFERYHYGHPFLASFFLFALVTLMPVEVSGKWFYLPAICELICGVMAARFVLWDDYKFKYSPIGAGLYVWTIMLMHFRLDGEWHVMILITWSIIYAIVLIPVWWSKVVRFGGTSIAR